MPRILSIDYGTKRCGIAETDDMQIIASALETIPRRQLFPFLDKYFKEREVNEVVIGQPFKMTGELNDLEKEILKFLNTFNQRYPKVQVHRLNEAFTSKMALESMIASGSKKKDRRKKENIDKIAATIILQEFLENRRNQRLT
ncbi:MAG TPA: Holliday junction resolvase RuvX [Cryomorphaceae bacterium]|nr:Holliday junction resolvase RuvX [Cryomorphaceae bacterium]